MPARFLLQNHAVTYSEPPITPAPTPMRNPKGLYSEWQIGVQMLRLGLLGWRLPRRPRGGGAPVILIPGWRAPEASMTPLRLYLRLLGYDARHWGFGVNMGDPEGDSHRLAARLQETEPAPVALVGWSLGGVVARETARLLPDLVTQVITYGTPVIGGPTYTLGARAWGRDECARISDRLDAEDAVNPISVPITAIFTRKDQVVSWPACIDRRSLTTSHIEVNSTHVSMGVDPDVWRSVALALGNGPNSAD